MAEYIESICCWCFHSYVCEQFNEHRDSNNKRCHFFNDHFVPAADVVPVVHGRWEEADDGDGVVCSICREDFCTIYLETERFNYCPNCGARMDGE